MYVTTLPTDVNVLKRRILEAAASVTEDILGRVRQKMGYKIDVCRCHKKKHISSLCKLPQNLPQFLHQISNTSLYFLIAISKHAFLKVFTAIPNTLYLKPIYNLIYPATAYSTYKCQKLWPYSRLVSCDLQALNRPWRSRHDNHRSFFGPIYTRVSIWLRKFLLRTWLIFNTFPNKSNRFIKLYTKLIERYLSLTLKQLGSVD